MWKQEVCGLHHPARTPLAPAGTARPGADEGRRPFGHARPIGSHEDPSPAPPGGGSPGRGMRYATTLTAIVIASGETYGEGTVATNQDDNTTEETFTVALGSNLPAAVTGVM